MTVINATKARENLHGLINDVNLNSEPVTLTNNKGEKAVLISENTWRAIQETAFFNSIPGMAESIISRGKTPLEECIPEDEVEW